MTNTKKCGILEKLLYREKRSKRPVKRESGLKKPQKTFKNLLTNARRCDIIDKLLSAKTRKQQVKITTGILKIEQYKNTTTLENSLFPVTGAEKQVKSDKT